jgi:holin-like protein
LTGAQFLLGLTCLIAIFISCEIIVKYFNISLPPALLGIGVLFVGLLFCGRLPVPIQKAARPLLAFMVVFFIPAIVGIVAYVSLIVQFPLALLSAIVGSTVVSLLITAWISQKLLGQRS